jgi:hypothetical protein
MTNSKSAKWVQRFGALEDCVIQKTAKGEFYARISLLAGKEDAPFTIFAVAFKPEHVEALGSAEIGEQIWVKGPATSTDQATGKVYRTMTVQYLRVGAPETTAEPAAESEAPKVETASTGNTVEAERMRGVSFEEVSPGLLALEDLALSKNEKAAMLALADHLVDGSDFHLDAAPAKTKTVDGKIVPGRAIYAALVRKGLVEVSTDSEAIVTPTDLGLVAYDGIVEEMTGRAVGSSVDETKAEVEVETEAA